MSNLPSRSIAACVAAVALMLLSPVCAQAQAPLPGTAMVEIDGRLVVVDVYFSPSLNSYYYRDARTGKEVPVRLGRWSFNPLTGAPRPSTGAEMRLEAQQRREREEAQEYLRALPPPGPVPFERFEKARQKKERDEIKRQMRKAAQDMQKALPGGYPWGAIKGAIAKIIVVDANDGLEAARTSNNGQGFGNR